MLFLIIYGQIIEGWWTGGISFKALAVYNIQLVFVASCESIG